MSDKNVELPHSVEIEIGGRSFLSPGRSCAEKRFALALIAGGVKNVNLSTSYWCGEPPSRDGCLMNTNSIEAHGGKRINGDHILWALLRNLDIPFSGGGSAINNWAQASWLPRKDGYHNEFYRMNLPMVVCYFNTMRDIKHEHS